MTAVVRLALARPYTFVVMAILVMIFGVHVGHSNPNRYLSQYRNSGHFGRLGLHRLVARRHGRPNRRALRTRPFHHGQRYRTHRVAVVSRHGRCQNLLPADRRHQRRPGAGHIDFANHSETASRGGHAADHPCLQRLERSDHPAGVIQRLSLPGGAVRSRPEFHSAAAHDGRRRPASVRLWRSDAPGADRPRPECAARPQSFSHRHRPALALQNQINPVGTEKIGSYEFTVDLNDSPKAVADFNNLPVKVVNGTVVFMRDVAYRPRRFAAADQCRPARRAQGHSDVRSQDRLGVHARHHFGHQGSPPRNRSHASSRRQPQVRCGPVRLRQIFRQRRRAGGIDRGHAHRVHDSHLSRQLAIDPHHHGFDTACGSELVDRAFPAWPDHQCHDARRPCSRRRHPGRRCDRHDREHQPPHGAWRGYFDRHHQGRERDHAARDGRLVLHLHRLRPAAHAGRSGGLSLPSARDGGRLRDDRLLHSHLHARADDGAFLT